MIMDIVCIAPTVLVVASVRLFTSDQFLTYVLNQLDKKEQKEKG